MEWLNVKDNPIPNRTYILGWGPTLHEPIPFFFVDGEYDIFDFKVTGISLGVPEEVTHWLLIPKPPEGI